MAVKLLGGGELAKAEATARVGLLHVELAIDPVTLARQGPDLSREVRVFVVSPNRPMIHGSAMIEPMIKPMRVGFRPNFDP
ncbi:hypothetical protein ACTMTI_16750 [Nonomuraea sp. H19]|uniref:hypothetical protein n=1 Tax=Nonomuraea sp. H19 TaxID=3452206 RepID=UPI003F8B521D